MAGILQRKKWILPVVIAAAAACVIFLLTSGAGVKNEVVSSGSLPVIEVDTILQQTRQKKGYEQYLSQAGEASQPNVDMTIEAGDYIRAEGEEARKLNDYEGKPGVSLHTGETGRSTGLLTCRKPGCTTSLLSIFP